MKMTQRQRILRYMKLHGSITPMEAMRDLGCMRLAARVFELREEGHAIESEVAHGLNRDGEQVTFTRYKLVKRGSL